MIRGNLTRSNFDLTVLERRSQWAALYCLALNDHGIPPNEARDPGINPVPVYSRSVPSVHREVNAVGFERAQTPSHLRTV